LGEWSEAAALAAGGLLLDPASQELQRLVRDAHAGLAKQWDAAKRTKVQRCNTCGGLARGDREWPLNDGQTPNPNVVRVAPGTGYHRG
jgi:hypothetical protein